MGILTLIGAIVVLGWVLGFSLHVLGNAVHFLLVVGVVLILLDVLSRRKP